LDNLYTSAIGMTVDKQPSVILLYHVEGGRTTRPSKDQTLKRICTLSDITQYNDCLETEGFDCRWEREIFFLLTAPSMPMGVHPVPSDGKRELGRKYFLVVKAAVI
jgi:hypothetical protein